MIIFENKGSTCFVNVALQLLLNNPMFRRAVLDSYFDEYESTSGFVREMRRCVREVESHETPSDACIGSINEFVKYSEFLQGYIRTHQQGDVLECVDSFLDSLTKPGSIRPQPMTFIDDRDTCIESVRNSITHHCGPLNVLWGLNQSIHTCMTCNQTVRMEILPFLWVSRVCERNVLTDVDCDKCGCRGNRTIETKLIIPPETIIVQVPARHKPDGTKDNRAAAMNSCVRIRNDVTGTERLYHMRVIVYHEGMSFAGGHYTCAVRNFQDAPWVLNSDAHVHFASGEFNIEKHALNSTYAVLYV